MHWRKDTRKEVTENEKRKHKQLLVDLKEKKGYRELKEEVPDRTVWRTGFERGFGLVDSLRDDEWMNECYL